MKVLERDIELKLLHWLNISGWFAWKNPTKPSFIEVGGRKVLKNRAKFEIVGASDIIAIRDGRVLFIEVKRPGGTQREGQVAFQSAIERHGGRYVLVKSLDELMEKI